MKSEFGTENGLDRFHEERKDRQIDSVIQVIIISVGQRE